MMKPLIAIVGIAIAGGIFFFYTQPAYDGVQAQKGEIQQYDQALNKAAELQELKQTLLSRYNAFDPADLDRLHKLLPDHVDNVRLVLDLDNLAIRHGMALQNVVISNAAAGEKSGNDVATIDVLGRAYDSLTLAFSTEGSYADFTAFLLDLENSLRIVDLVSLKLDPGAETARGEPMYRYAITLRTYWLK